MTPSKPELPYLIEAEQAVLAAALLDSRACTEAIDQLEPLDFYRQGHRAIFRAMVALSDRGESVGLVTVTEELRRRSQLEAAGGATGVQSLVDSSAPIGQTTAHLRIVREHADRRRLLEKLARSTERINAGDATPAEILADLAQADTSTNGRIEWLDLRALAEQGIEPIPWLVPDWLTVDDIAMIAGGAYSGKSTVCYDLADALARGRPWCGIMPTAPARVLVVDEEQGSRAAARLALRIGAGYGDPPENLRVCSGQGICLSLPESVRRLEREIAEFRPALLVIDSVQTVFGLDDENSSAEVGRIYGELFRLRDKHRPLAVLLIHHKRKSAVGIQQELIELVRGSTAHGTQASTVWYLARNGTETADLRQAKRREAQPRSMRIGYTEDGPDGAIRLEGLGSVAQAETRGEQAVEWLTGYLADRSPGTIRWRDILATGQAEGFTKATLIRAKGTLERLNRLVSPSRGLYQLKAWTKPEPNLVQGVQTELAPDGLESSGGAHLEAPRALGLVDPNLNQKGTEGD